MSLLQVKKIRYRNERKVVIDSLSLKLEQGQLLGVMGETGSGKSTLLKLIAGLLQPQSGEVLLEGEPVRGPMDRLVPGHPRIAYLSQHFELQKSLTVKQVLSYANRMHDDDAERIIGTCHVRHLLERKTDQLSGGERQRVAFAKVLLAQPQVLLLDEPFSNLDLLQKEVIQQVIENALNGMDISTILVSHDPDDVLPWADEILIMRHGNAIQKGQPAALYASPINEYVAGLTGRYFLLSATLASQLGVDLLPGESKIVRPNQIALSVANKNSLQGKIVEKKFYGTHSEIKVAVEGELVLAIVNNNAAAIGQDVSLSWVGKQVK